MNLEKLKKFTNLMKQEALYSLKPIRRIIFNWEVLLQVEQDGTWKLDIKPHLKRKITLQDRYQLNVINSLFNTPLKSKGPNQWEWREDAMSEKEFTTDYKTLLDLMQDPDLAKLIRGDYTGNSMVCIVKDPSNKDDTKEICALSILTSSDHDFPSEISFGGHRLKLIPQLKRLINLDKKKKKK